LTSHPTGHKFTLGFLEGGRGTLKVYSAIHTFLADLSERARDDRGATGVEYGLLVALIAAVIVVVVSILGKKVSNAFQSVNAAIT
jgi:pilus assembly protein Flp/PilA